MRRPGGCVAHWLGSISSLIGRALLPRAGVIVALIVPAISALVLGGTCFALLNTAVGTPPARGLSSLEILAPQAFDEIRCRIVLRGQRHPRGAGQLATAVGNARRQDRGRVGRLVRRRPEQPGQLPRRVRASPFSSTRREKGRDFESFGVIFSTKLEVDVAPDELTGTIRFDGLAAEPTGAPAADRCHLRIGQLEL